MSEISKSNEVVHGASAGDTKEVKVMDANSAFWFLMHQTEMSKKLNLTLEQQRKMMIESLSVVKESAAKGF